LRAKAVEDAARQGLPEALAVPLRFLADRRLPAGDDRERQRGVERLREDLIAGDRVGHLFSGRELSLHELATQQSITAPYGTLLYLLAKHAQAEAILEFGACVGISGAYLAATGARRFVSMEAGDLAEIADRTVKAVNPRATVVRGFFDDLLPELLPEFEDGLDFVWIDGNHKLDPTLRYFEAVKPKLKPGSLVVFDDITWSDEMREAWARIQTSAGLAHAVTLQRIGITQWDGVSPRPRTWDLRVVG
jgi:predicted O-methyltransferase YrrM